MGVVDTFTVLIHIAMALGLGFIVGLQRQVSANEIAGIRTFPLIAVFGVFAGLFAIRYGGVILAAGFIALAAMLWMGNYARWKQAGTHDPGLTTEFAILVMFCVGAALPAGFTGPAVVVTGAVAVLLHYKSTLHNMAGNIDEDEIRALLRLVLIGLVILPALPNQAYGPYGVLNPFNIWLMVVLIVGVSMAAYVVYRLLGTRVGTLLGGVFGGLISSTATTVSYARLCKSDPRLVPQAALVIFIASALVFVRVLAEIALVARHDFLAMAPPLVFMLLFMGGLSVVAYFLNSDALDAAPERRPPKDLKAAIVFGLLYAVVILAAAAAQEHLGREALYGVAAVSGMTDMDAITLSTSQLVHQGMIPPETGWRLILVGGLANLVFKGGAVLALGGWALFRRILPLFGVTMIAGLAVLLLWP